MRKEIVTQVQETQTVPNRINPRQNTIRQIIIKITKAEDRIREVEDRMVEFNETEEKRKSELKKMRTISETSSTMLNVPTFE